MKRAWCAALICILLLMVSPSRAAERPFLRYTSDYFGTVSMLCLDEEEGAPQPAQAAVEGALADHLGEEVGEVLAHVPHQAPLRLPRHPAAPLGGQPQAQDLAVGEPRGRASSLGHVGADMGLVEVIDHDV